MIIKLGPTDLAVIREFCEKVQVARRKRDSRNKDTGEHRIIREMLGKTGEYAAWKATGLGSVDFQIYPDGTVFENCSGDLGPHWHVKTANTQYRGTRYDGWLVGKGEKIVDTPTIRDILILCYADDTGEVDVIGWVRATEVKSFYRRPVSPKLNHKTALYYDDIKHLIYNLEDLKDEDCY